MIQSIFYLKTKMMKTKKILITTIAILSCILSTQAQNVYIPDSIFKTALVNNASINTNRDTAIQVSEAAAYVGAINISNIIRTQHRKHQK